MMIIGTGKSRRISEHINNLRCPYCGGNGTLLMEGYQEYLIFGLPVFPTSKIVVVTCSSCKKYYPPSEITHEMFQGVQYIKSKMKPRFWMFLLPVIIGSVLFFKMISEIRITSGNSPKIENVQVGDVYTLETGDMRYNKMKVLFVKDDAIVFHKSGHSSVKLKKLKYIDDFYGDTIVYSKSDLMKLNDDHKIEDISKEE